jgi:hypothetical protein
LGRIGHDSLWAISGATFLEFRSISDSPNGRANWDIVRDFELPDYIDLHLIGANVIWGGNQTFRFIDERWFTGRVGELRYDEGRGLLSGDVNGDARGDFTIVVANHYDLESYDFHTLATTPSLQLSGDVNGDRVADFEIAVGPLGAGDVLL